LTLGRGCTRGGFGNLGNISVWACCYIQLLLLNTDIVSRVPISQQVFRPISRYTLVMAGQQWDQALLVCAGFHVASLRRSQSQLDALSAALPRARTELFLDLPFMPRAPKAFQTDWAGKPLHPTSTGKTQLENPFSLHKSASSWYFDRFLSFASSVLSSQGTVSSTSIIIFGIVDKMTMSGRRLVCTTSGKTNLRCRSTFISQCLASCSRPVFWTPFALCPGFTKLMKPGPLVSICLSCLLSFSRMSAI